MAREEQIDGEHAHADRAERHEADFDAPLESFSHISEPRPMPIENVAEQHGHDVSSPGSTSFAKTGKRRRKRRAEEPHPRDAQQRSETPTRFSRASFRLRQVSLTGFQLMRRSGCGAGVAGTKCDTQPPHQRNRRRRRTASTHRAVLDGTATQHAADNRGRAGSRRRCPSRPCRCRRSVRDFDRCCGRYEYLTGPNRVECTPIRKRARAVQQRRAMKPETGQPISITAISKLLDEARSASPCRTCPRSGRRWPRTARTAG